jgi:Xaa-Pro aminopeptidase
MSLSEIQTYLLGQGLDGWLLYSFRQLNPIALSVAGLQSGGSRRWFLWIPARGRPSWLIHAIESNTFVDVNPELQGEMIRYVSWQDLRAMLPRLLGVESGRKLKIAMEYSPENAIPYVSRVDAGTLELVTRSTGAEVVSSADLVQLVQAVLTPEQLLSHRRAAAVCLAAKDAAFEFIAQRLRNGQPITEFQAQQYIADYFVGNGMVGPMSSLVSVNGNAADPHYMSNERRHSPIHIGDMILIDLWSREIGDPNNVFADCTWTAFAGACTPPKVTEVFNVVAASRDRAVEFIQQRLDANQPVYGYEVDDACRQVIVDAGFGDAILHRTGHSLGPIGHYIGANIDNLETQDRRQLIPGIMFTIEPGIYLADYNFDDSPTPKGLGIRSEINCTMHDDRVEVTTLPLQTEVAPLLA